MSAAPIAVGGAALAWRLRLDEQELWRQRKEARLLAGASRVASASGWLGACAGVRP